MEISHENFSKKYTRLKQQIDKSYMISFKVNPVGETPEKIHLEDLPEVFYKKMQPGPTTQAIIKVGLTFYEFDKVAQDRNKRNKNSNEILFTSSSQTFILNPFGRPKMAEQYYSFDSNYIMKLDNDNKFDWSTVFTNGLPQMRDNEQLDQHTRYENVLKYKTTSYHYPFQNLDEDEDQELNIYLDNINAIIKKNRDITETTRFEITSNDFISMKIQKALANKCKTQQWEATISLQLKIVDEDEFFPADGDENVKKIQIYLFPSEKDFLLFVNNLKNEQLNKQLHTVGFSEIQNLVFNSKKILVGQNCLNDLLHLQQKFVKDIPHDLLTFKRLFSNSKFNLQDCKYIFENEGMKKQVKYGNQVSLEELQEYTMKNEGFMNQSIKQEQEMESDWENPAFKSQIIGQMFIKIRELFIKNITEDFNNTNVNSLCLDGTLYSLKLSKKEDEQKYGDKSRCYYIRIDATNWKVTAQEAAKLENNLKKQSIVNQLVKNVDVKLNNLKYKLKLRDDFEIKENKQNDMFIFVSQYDSEQLINLRLHDQTIMRMETFEYMKRKNLEK